MSERVLFPTIDESARVARVVQYAQPQQVFFGVASYLRAQSQGASTADVNFEWSSAAALELEHKEAKPPPKVVTGPVVSRRPLGARALIPEVLDS